MARPLRLERSDALWHLTARGNEKQDIFRNEDDRKRFLTILARVVHQRRWKLHGYVLMGNHYHLLVTTPEPNLSRGMRDLNGNYAQSFNRRHKRVGHLLQGRFTGIHVERESHLLELVRYIVLNPVAAGLVKDPAGWEWTSYRATAGMEAAPPWLEVGWTWSQFDPDPGNATRRFQEFVREGATRSPWKSGPRGIYLGGPDFRARMQALVDSEKRSPEFPRAHVLPGRPDPATLPQAVLRAFGSEAAVLRRHVVSDVRLALAVLGRDEGALRLAEIGALIDVGRSRASALAGLGERRLDTDRFFVARCSRALEIARDLSSAAPPVRVETVAPGVGPPGATPP